MLDPPRISIIIPAFNEERALPETLAHLGRSRARLGEATGLDVEVIVVDNASHDRTAEIANDWGARVISFSDHNIARVRNAGAEASSGDLLVFLDADTKVPHMLLTRVVEVMADTDCLGGAVDTDYRPRRLWVRAYLRGWRRLGRILGMAQGACQFARREGFDGVLGYDPTLYMGEDVDFYWRLGRFAKARGRHLRFLKEIRVVPSCRRFDQWPSTRILIQTNPLFIMLHQRQKGAWHGWYEDVPR